MSDNEVEVLVDPPELERLMLSALVGTKVNKIEFYRRAFTHKSALKRYKGLTGSYETLEFMGDSVLGFIITKHLFDLYEKEQEGFLTKARTKMVRGKTLCEIAKVLKLDEHILMDEKGIRNGWNNNANILEDVFEALVGAVYLDIGMIAAKKFIFDSFSKVQTSLHDDNYKDQLMRWCQALKLPLPEYKIASNANGRFAVIVFVDEVETGWGFGNTKKEAEQNAAEITLKTEPRFKGKEPPNGKWRNTPKGESAA